MPLEIIRTSSEVVISEMLQGTNNQFFLIKLETITCCSKILIKILAFTLTHKKGALI